MGGWKRDERGVEKGREGVKGGKEARGEERERGG